TDNLIEKGVEEIQAIGNKFLSLKDPQKPVFDAIFTSPAARAVQTAEILERIIDPENSTSIITQDSRLRQKHWGHFHGKTIDSEYKQTRIEGEKATDLLPTFMDKLNF